MTHTINQSGLIFSNHTAILPTIYDANNVSNNSTFSNILSHSFVINIVFLNNIEYAYYVIRLLLGIFIFFGNGLTIMSFFKFEYLRSITNVFVTSLAFSDFLSSFILLL